MSKALRTIDQINFRPLEREYDPNSLEELINVAFEYAKQRPTQEKKQQKSWSTFLKERQEEIAHIFEESDLNSSDRLKIKASWLQTKLKWRFSGVRNFDQSMLITLSTILLELRSNRKYYSSRSKTPVQRAKSNFTSLRSEASMNAIREVNNLDKIGKRLYNLGFFHGRSYFNLQKLLNSRSELKLTEQLQWLESLTDEEFSHLVSIADEYQFLFWGKPTQTIDNIHSTLKIFQKIYDDGATGTTTLLNTLRSLKAINLLTKTHTFSYTQLSIFDHLTLEKLESNQKLIEAHLVILVGLAQQDQLSLSLDLLNQLVEKHIVVQVAQLVQNGWYADAFRLSQVLSSDSDNVNKLKQLLERAHNIENAIRGNNTLQIIVDLLTLVPSKQDQLKYFSDEKHIIILEWIVDHEEKIEAELSLMIDFLKTINASDDQIIIALKNAILLNEKNGVIFVYTFMLQALIENGLQNPTPQSLLSMANTKRSGQINRQVESYHRSDFVGGIDKGLGWYLDINLIQETLLKSLVKSVVRNREADSQLTDQHYLKHDTSLTMFLDSVRSDVKTDTIWNLPSVNGQDSVSHKRYNVMPAEIGIFLERTDNQPLQQFFLALKTLGIDKFPDYYMMVGKIFINNPDLLQHISLNEPISYDLFLQQLLLNTVNTPLVRNTISYLFGNYIPKVVDHKLWATWSKLMNPHSKTSAVFTSSYFLLTHLNEHGTYILGDKQLSLSFFQHYIQHYAKQNSLQDIDLNLEMLVVEDDLLPIKKVLQETIAAGYQDEASDAVMHWHELTILLKTKNGENLIKYTATRHWTNIQAIILSQSLSLIDPKIELDFDDEGYRRYFYDWSQIKHKSIQEKLNQKWLRGDSLPQLNEYINKYHNIITMIDRSSVELKRIQDNILLGLLTIDNYQETIQSLDVVFTNAVLPQFIQNFILFKFLYLSPGVDFDQTLFAQKIARVHTEQQTPLAIPLENARHQEEVVKIVKKDLLNILIDSGNQEIAYLLEQIKQVHVLLSQVTAQNKVLNTQETIVFDNFLQLTTSVINGLTNNGHEPFLILTGNQAHKIKQIEEYTQLPSQQLPSYLMGIIFGKDADIHDIEQIQLRIDRVRLEAENRNMAFVKDGHLTSTLITPRALTKSVPLEHIHSILNNGLLSREYIGGDLAHSDSTPFDTDFGMIDDDPDQSFTEIVNNSSAMDYDGVIVLINDRRQFSETPNEDQYELIHSAVVGNDHYGIRTGMPTTEINAFILQKNLSSSGLELELEILKNIIAFNQLYIPVLDTTGILLFSPEEYQRYKPKYSWQTFVQNLPETSSAQDIIVQFESITPFIKKLFKMSSGVSEGYSLEEHIIMVVNQYQKYFKEKSQFFDSIISPNEMLLVLLVHDLGKPLAYLMYHNTGRQHEVTLQIINLLLQSLEISIEKLKLITYIINQNILGELFTHEISLENAAIAVIRLGQQIDVNPLDLLQLLKVFYICDASSYTKDAGGLASLEAIFTFHQDSADFSPSLKEIFDELTLLIKQKYQHRPQIGQAPLSH